ncbi:hypothetical protein F5Y16DRAFT_284276 [Xylariaceae sp. FL0255]|nr:hypothetical protein F5Y16DRAFT_284276 [Xylariaceae sp. FL0255]
MGLAMRVGATALASMLAMSSVANAQAFYWQDERKSCDPKYNYQYLGCAPWAGPDSPLTFSPNNWDATGDNSYAWINYDTGDIVNNTETSFFCAEVCRAFGYKYTALYQSHCSCGGALKYTPQGGSEIDIVPGTDQTICTDRAGGGPYGGCAGDSLENCGSDQGAQIWVDPSFADPATLATGATLAEEYGVMGCFQNPDFPSSAALTTGPVNQLDGPTCLAYCGSLGLPLAYMNTVTSSTSGQVGCYCGSAFGKNAQEVDSTATDSCYVKCSDPSSTAQCSGTDCCGGNNGPFPVYANPKLMGCYTPIIPGKTDPSSNDPAPNGYDCFPTPASIASRPSSAVYAANPAATMSRSASWLAEAKPTTHAYSNFGCYASKALTDVFSDTPHDSGLQGSTIDIDGCVKYCDNNNYNFAAIYGSGATTACACANDATGVAPNGNMQDCGEPCPNPATQQNCGGNTGPIVYAIAGTDLSQNAWAQSYSANWAQTITYSCKPSKSLYPLA